MLGEYENRIWTLKKEIYTINFTVNKYEGTMHEKCCYFSPDQIAHIQRLLSILAKICSMEHSSLLFRTMGVHWFNPMHLSKACWQIKKKREKKVLIDLFSFFNIYIAHCLKITQNVAFEFSNFGIFHQFLSY